MSSTDAFYYRTFSLPDGPLQVLLSKQDNSPVWQSLPRQVKLQTLKLILGWFFTGCMSLGAFLMLLAAPHANASFAEHALLWIGTGFGLSVGAIWLLASAFQQRIYYGRKLAADEAKHLRQQQQAHHERLEASYDALLANGQLDDELALYETQPKRRKARKQQAQPELQWPELNA